MHFLLLLLAVFFGRIMTKYSRTGQSLSQFLVAWYFFLWANVQNITSFSRLNDPTCKKNIEATQFLGRPWSWKDSILFHTVSLADEAVRTPDHEPKDIVWDWMHFPCGVFLSDTRLLRILEDPFRAGHAHRHWFHLKDTYPRRAGRNIVLSRPVFCVLRTWRRMLFRTDFMPIASLKYSIEKCVWRALLYILWSRY